MNVLKSRLDNFTIQKTESGHTLSSLIKLNDFQGSLGNNIKILSGTVFDEYVRTSSRINKSRNDSNGLFTYTIESNPYVDVRAGDFWILNDGMLVNRTKGSRAFVSNVISSALKSNIKPFSINIMDMASDYPDNWIGGIVDRNGNWQKGTLHGDNLRNDDCIGGEFVACTKNQVGSYTEYFGGKTKFKVTKDGIVTLYTDLGEDIENFLRFTKNEIQEYFQ